MINKFLTTLLLVTGCLAPAMAQVFLVDVCKPTDSYNFSEVGYVGMHPYKKSICVFGPNGGLTGGADMGRVTYKLGGKYAKLSFMLGDSRASQHILGYDVYTTILGDGMPLYEAHLYDYNAPRWKVIDVSGVDEIQFLAVKGKEGAGFGYVQLWKAGEKPVAPKAPVQALPAGRIELVKDLEPYYRQTSGCMLITDNPGPGLTSTISRTNKKYSINRKSFGYGLSFDAPQGLIESYWRWCYFWLNKRYSKLSFIVGPQDNQSTNTSAWLVVKADGKTVYEGVVRQNDLARRVVVDVSGAEEVAFIAQRRSGDLFGNMNFGLVDIYAYPADYANVPEAGTVNLNESRISKLPDVCPLMSNIRPYSVRGMGDANQTLFYGLNRFITFPMGGVNYYQGFLLRTGNTLLNDRVDAYAEFDLGGSFDYIGFDVGTYSLSHALDEDTLRVYADGRLLYNENIRCTWPNQHIVLPLNKCRKLRFEKLGNGRRKQLVIGIADPVLYCDSVVAKEVFHHDIPDCPDEADLIDLCGKPYFHYVARYCDSQVTNFKIDDCFCDGRTSMRSFTTKDKKPIYKGVMLETNVASPLEFVTPMDILFMGLCSAGATISASDVAAASGVSAGMSGIGLSSFMLHANQNRKLASAFAYNPYGQYQTCTFTVTNILAHKDEFSGQSPRVKLDVLADHRLVGEFWLSDDMEPTTYTVPIFGCKQLMFWLEPNDVRSGQYVFYDIKVSKTPCNLPTPKQYTPAQ